MFSQLKIRDKISLMVIISIFIFVIIVMSNYFFRYNNEQLISEIETGYVSALELSRDLEETLLSLQYAMQNAVAAADEDELVIADSLYKIFLLQLNTGRNNPTISEEILNRMEKDLAIYYRLADKNVRRMILGEFNEETIAALEVMKEQYNSIKTTLADKTRENKIKMTEAFRSTKTNYEASTLLTNSVIFIVMVLFSILGYYIIRSIDKPLNEIVNAANDLAQGKVDVALQVTTRDEFGFLAKAFVSLIDATKDLTRAANAIGQGDYSYSVRVRSKADVLGNALEQMKRNLIEISQENTQQNWLKTGQTELHAHMSGELGIEKMAQNVIQFLCGYLDAQVGAIYLLPDQNRLKMVGSYSLAVWQESQKVFEIGEGLVGQSALAQKTILLKNVPEGYLSIRSGLGEATPANVLVTPFIYEGNIIGAIELGKFGEFTENELLFLEQVNPNIAINFQTAESRTKLKDLLEATQKQAEELRIQQEELRRANERLEIQTAALRQSEKQLQLQQQALQSSNTELEAQTHELEKQQTLLKRKNEELKIAQKLVEEKARDLELANKYKSEFLANMSHELRTPLNSLLILSKMLSENKTGNLTEGQIRYAQIINSAGTDLLTLINDILDLSKVESGKLQIDIRPTDLRNLLSDIELQFGHVAEQKGVDFAITYEKDAPGMIDTDSLRLSQVLKNLLSNAFKFTESGGVTINVRKFNGKRKLQRAALAENPAMVISVRDSGVGIAAEKHQLIFEAFQQADGTTSRKYGGTGLGLSISRELVNILGGEMFLESEPGNGSTFGIILPAKSSGIIPVEHDAVLAPPQNIDFLVENTPAPEPKPIAITDDRAMLESDDRVILIIEDDPEFANILLTFVHERNFKGIIAGDGDAGLQFAQQLMPHGIILDLGLPGRNGWNVLDTLKNDTVTRHIPVHVISGQSALDDALKLGAIGVMHKPVSVEQLQSAFLKIQRIAERYPKKLLIVEDDDNLRENLADFFASEDLQITTFANGTDAIDILHKDEFDCILLDLGLKDMSGIDLLESLQTRPDVNLPAVIIYTGKDLSPDEQGQLQLLAQRVLKKGNCPPEKLLDETNLFLHRLTERMPENQQQMIESLPAKADITEGKKILLVDDDMRNLFALTQVLESRGMKVSTGKNGVQALKMLASDPQQDLILMDIMMPEMDGFEAMRQIRSQEIFKDTPIIALTAKVMQSDRDSCFSAGANDFLPKPVDEEHLISLIRVWLSQ